MVTLNSEDSITEFLTLPSSEKYNTRVILFVYNQEDYDEEILKVKSAAI